jgi:hypothetical protein
VTFLLTLVGIVATLANGPSETCSTTCFGTSGSDASVSYSSCSPTACDRVGILDAVSTVTPIAIVRRDGTIITESGPPLTNPGSTPSSSISTTAPSSGDQNDGSSGGLSKGAIAGISIAGSIAGIVAAVVAVYTCCRK